MTRRLSKPAHAITLAFLVLAACDQFEPRYSDRAMSSIEKGHAEIATLVAATNLGQFESPASYSGAADQYASALGQVALTREFVATISVEKATSATEAKRLMLEQIDACIDAVTQMSEQHKHAGLTAGAGYNAVQTTCYIPLNNMNK